MGQGDCCGQLSLEGVGSVHTKARPWQLTYIWKIWDCWVFRALYPGIYLLVVEKMWAVWKIYLILKTWQHIGMLYQLGNLIELQHSKPKWTLFLWMYCLLLRLLSERQKKTQTSHSICVQCSLRPGSRCCEISRQIHIDFSGFWLRPAGLCALIADTMVKRYSTKGCAEKHGFWEERFS